MDSVTRYHDQGMTIFGFEKLSLKKDDNGKLYKKIIGLPTNWQQLNINSCKSTWEGDKKGWAILTGEQSNITVIDIDNEESYSKILELCPEIKDYKTIKTKNGYHIYCLYDSEVLTTTNIFKDYIPKIDIRNDKAMVFCSPTKYSYLSTTYSYEDKGGEIKKFPSIIKQKINEVKSNKNEKPKKSNREKEKKENNKESTKKNNIKEDDKSSIIEYYIDNGFLDHKAFSDSWDDWINIGFAIYHTDSSEIGRELFHSFSKRNINKYDSNITDEKWNGIKERDHHFSFSTIVKWVEENIIIVEDENEAIIKLYDKYKNDLIYTNEQLFFKKDNIYVNNNVKETLYCNILEEEVYLELYKTKFIPTKLITKHKHIIDIVNGIINKSKNNYSNTFYDLFHSSTKGRLCFNNGVYSFIDKKFYNWNNKEYFKKNPIYSTQKISYDYVDFKEKDHKMYKDEVYNFYKSIFDEDTEKVLSYKSRAYAGHNEDKDWFMFQGERDCGKGCIDNFDEYTFEKYKGILPIQYFYKDKDGTDPAKKNAMLFDKQFTRFVTLQEADFDEKIILDGTKIKTIASGGDSLQSRKNFMDASEIKIDFKLMFMANDFPKIVPFDCKENLHYVRTVKQYKDQNFIDQRRQKLKDEGNDEKLIEIEMKRYNIADPSIKNVKIHSMEWKLAHVHLLIEYYSSNKIKIATFEDADDDEKTPTDFLKEIFTITNFDEDRLSNKEIKDYCKEKGIEISANKINGLLKSLGCIDYRTSKERGLKKIIKKI